MEINSSYGRTISCPLLKLASLGAFGSLFSGNIQRLDGHVLRKFKQKGVVLGCVIDSFRSFPA